jgi:hypothetical protein
MTSEADAFHQEKGMGGRIVKLTPVVALNSLHSIAELCRDIGKEIGKVVKVSDLCLSGNVQR